MKYKNVVQPPMQDEVTHVKWMVQATGGGVQLFANGTLILSIRDGKTRGSEISRQKLSPEQAKALGVRRNCEGFMATNYDVVQNRC